MRPTDRKKSLKEEEEEAMEIDCLAGTQLTSLIPTDAYMHNFTQHSTVDTKLSFCET